jgi:hypothetical protein
MRMRWLPTIVSLAVLCSIGLSREAAAQAPVKIGFLAPLSGAIAQAGKEHTYPAVSQFWTYDPAEFLKQPVYSRDFPPCRHC